MQPIITENSKSIRKKMRIVRITQCFVCSDSDIVSSLNVSDHREREGAQISLCATCLDNLRGFFAAARLTAKLWPREEAQA